MCLLMCIAIYMHVYMYIHVRIYELAYIYIYIYLCIITLHYGSSLIGHKAAMNCADRLVFFYSEDRYPPLDVETICSIEMGTGIHTHSYIGVDYPIGKLKYSALRHLYGAFLEFACVSSNEEEE
jgi:hypothetical protein